MLDTRDLGRRPGAMKRVSRTVDAPAGLGSSVLAVPTGAEVHLDLRLESVMEGVLVSGSAVTAVTGDCVRCLDPVRQDLDIDLQQLYVYAGTAESEEVEDEELLELDGDLLSLEPLLRDAVVLALPLQPLCSPDCPGLCAECGARLADDPSHSHDKVDARWAALVSMRETFGDRSAADSGDDAESVRFGSPADAGDTTQER